MSVAFYRKKNPRKYNLWKPISLHQFALHSIKQLLKHVRYKNVLYAYITQETSKGHVIKQSDIMTSHISITP